MSAPSSYANRLAAGLCTRCGGPRGESQSNHFCAPCHARHKTACRNRSRLKAGIPLDLPLQQSRTVRAKHRRCLELEAAFRRAISHLTRSRRAA